MPRPSAAATDQADKDNAISPVRAIDSTIATKLNTPMIAGATQSRSTLPTRGCA